VDAVFEHVIEEIAADHPLAHEPPHSVGKHGEHGIDLARADERFERLGDQPARALTISSRGNAWVGGEADES